MGKTRSIRSKRLQANHRAKKELVQEVEAQRLRATLARLQTAVETCNVFPLAKRQEEKMEVDAKPTASAPTRQSTDSAPNTASGTVRKEKHLKRQQTRKENRAATPALVLRNKALAARKNKKRDAEARAEAKRPDPYAPVATIKKRTHRKSVLRGIPELQRPKHVAVIEHARTVRSYNKNSLPLTEDNRPETYLPGSGPNDRDDWWRQLRIERGKNIVRKHASLSRGLNRLKKTRVENMPLKYKLQIIKSDFVAKKHKTDRGEKKARYRHAMSIDRKKTHDKMNSVINTAPGWANSDV